SRVPIEVAVSGAAATALTGNGPIVGVFRVVTRPDALRIFRIHQTVAVVVLAVAAVIDAPLTLCYLALASHAASSACRGGRGPADRGDADGIGRAKGGTARARFGCWLELPDQHVTLARKGTKGD